MFILQNLALNNSGIILIHSTVFYLFLNESSLNITVLFDGAIKIEKILCKDQDHANLLHSHDILSPDICVLDFMLV